MEDKRSIRSQRGWHHARWVVIGLVLAVYVLWERFVRGYNRHRGGDTPNIPTGSYFTLESVHRHGIGTQYMHHQVLDMTPEVVAEAGARFQLAEMSLSELTDDEETLWTRNSRYRTENPYTYKFSIPTRNQSTLRMQERSPEFMAFLATPQGQHTPVAWAEEEVQVPDVESKDAVIALALMSSNAYVEVPFTGDWRNVTAPWDEHDSQGYGWDGEGLRGHVFYNSQEDIVVISVKGTSAQGIPGSGDDETTAQDKINDNLLFSCCCARVSYLWSTVCDCYVKGSTCDESCLEKELRRKDRYYQAVVEIYAAVLKDHPSAAVWMTGHSLGGSLASLIGRTFGLPVVAFEAPGEQLAAKRLHLPFPPGLPSYLDNVWHFGHTADPIFLGTCNGASSSCSIAGYAMETACHTGQVCVYDVVKDKGWHVNMLNHRIHTVIDSILNEYNETAKCITPEPCVDCYNWKYWPDRSGKKHPSSTITASSSTATSSVAVCIGRNWLGICTAWATVPATDAQVQTAPPAQPET
ncbi:triglyceride lipase [Maudiozyma humilis]|uniref:Putative lipase ATG15 n=1 Tax=Maudiozyma humilis TaxID=51915 RepID=A0AAV5SCN2_MAUHU|nr:triglyceride lipase [Kazachstania humilis]